MGRPIPGLTRTQQPSGANPRGPQTWDDSVGRARRTRLPSSCPHTSAPRNVGSSPSLKSESPRLRLKGRAPELLPANVTRIQRVGRSRNQCFLPPVWTCDRLSMWLWTVGPWAPANVPSPQEMRTPWQIRPSSSTESSWRPATQAPSVSVRLSVLPSASCTPRSLTQGLVPVIRC